MLLVLPPNSKPESQENLMTQVQEVATKDALLFDHSASTQAPALEPGTDRNSVLAVDAWMHGDFLCRNYILNGLDDSLYNVYVGSKNYVNTTIEQR